MYYLLEMDCVGFWELVVDEEAAIVAQKMTYTDQTTSFFIGHHRVYFAGDQSQEMVAEEPGLPAVG